MYSSYKNKVDFGDIITTVTFLQQPKKIVEFGILHGFSLMAFVNSSSPEVVIDAYDIFDQFNGNSSKRDELGETFDKFKNVHIQTGDFYEVYKSIPNNSIDILHVDIANNGDVYEFTFENYINKMSEGGVILLEGGSHDRDNVEWMTKYNKQKIQPILEKYKSTLNVRVIGTMPSVTIVKT